MAGANLWGLLEAKYQQYNELFPHKRRRKRHHVLQANEGGDMTIAAVFGNLVIVHG